MINQPKLAISSEAERAVLIAMVTNQTALPWILSNVVAKDFTNGDMRAVFGVVSSLFAAGTHVNLVTVANEYRKQVGKAFNVAELFKDDAAAVDFRGNVATLKDLSHRRKIQYLLNEALGQVDTSQDIEQLVYTLTSRLTQLASDQAKQISSMEKVTLMSVKRIENAAENKGGGSIGIPTGLKGFDGKIGGVRPGEVMIVGARPSMGKSSLLTTIARNSGMLGFGSIIINAEMQLVDVGTRMLARETGISNFDLRAGRVDESDTRDIARAAGDLSKLPISFYDDSRWEQAKMQIRLAKQQRKDLAWLMIDYIQLVRVERQEGEKRYEAIGRVVKETKALCDELQLAGLIAAQIGRDVEKEKKEPDLSALRESGDMEQDADIVTFLHRFKDKDEKENVYWLIKKNRNGPTGSVHLRFIENLVAYFDWNEE